MRMCLIGAATIALAASTAFADPGKGHGGGNGGGNGANHGPAAASPAKGGGHGQGQAKQEKAGPVRQAKAEHGPSTHGGEGKAAKPQADRGPARKAAPAFAQGGGNGGKGHSDDVRIERTRDVREVNDVRRSNGDRDDRRVVRSYAGFDHDLNRGLINGCPPGLAKKNNGCQPPGLAKDRDGYRGSYYRRWCSANRASWSAIARAKAGRPMPRAM